MVWTYAGRFGAQALVDASGNAQTTASVLVKNTDNSTATLYTDHTKAFAHANPLTLANGGLDAAGNLAFHATPGLYDLQITVGAAVRTIRVAVPVFAGESESVLNVMAYGAKGYPTDDTAAIQAAITAAGALGGAKVFFPPGSYRITSGLTSAATNGIELCGVGGVGQDNLLSNGATQIILDAANIWGFTFNPTSGASMFGGPVIRNLQFRATNASAYGGIRLKNCSNFLLDNVNCSDFTNGTGFLSDGTGAVNQYGTLLEYKASRCLIGADILNSNGIRFLGGYIDNNGNSIVSIPSGSIGVRITGGDTNMLLGTVIQCAETLVHMASGIYHEMHGVRLEAWTANAVYIEADYCAVHGGAIDNFIMGGIGTGYNIRASANRTCLFLGHMGSMATTITDLGTETVWFANGAQHMPTMFRRGQSKRTAGNVTVNSTSWANVDTGTDLVIPAAAGDIIEVSVNGLWNSDPTSSGQLDVATIVSGSPVTYFSSGTGTPATNGVPGWLGWQLQGVAIGPPIQLVLGSGDISGGTVTLRLRTRTSTTDPHVLLANSDIPLLFTAKNLGTSF